MWEDFWIWVFGIVLVGGMLAVIFISVHIGNLEDRANCDRIASLTKAQSHKMTFSGCDLVIDGKIIEVQ